MSGDSQRSEDPDFLDDDFVIEDLAGKQEDLEQLFTTPAQSAPVSPDAPPDADDLLFTDHTQGLSPSEQFQGRTPFAEQAPSQWDGQNLELDSELGVPPAEAEPAANPVAETPLDPLLKEAEAEFTAELGSMLQAEEDFALDSDQELEVEGATGADGVSEFEQSGPFVLDDGEGAWQQDETASTPAAASGGGSEAESVEPELEAVASADGDEAEATESDAGEQEIEAMPVLESTTGDDATAAEGWEPLPASNVDQLAEVGEVERKDGDTAVEPEPALVGAAAAAEVEGHDIYAEQAEQPGRMLVGPRSDRRRGKAVWLSLAASVTLIGGAAAVVLRPEWFGLAFAPEQVQQVQVERPVVKVAVPTPAPLANPNERKPAPKVEPKPEPKVEPKTEPKVEPKAEPKAEPKVEPKVEPTTEPKVEPKTEPKAEPKVEPKVEPTVVTLPAPTTEPVATTPQPAPSGPLPVVTAPTTREPDAWPAPETKPSATLTSPKSSSPLVRIGDDLMVGDVVPGTGKPTSVVDGVMPGSRAFAQLHNGNYFIGSVKSTGADRITLRVDDGEVTLNTDELSRFTELGSADYEELQKATSGFVRLTNNNRLVGGILSRIADDHIVLEFRSNRVMLPKSAVGQVVQGEDDAGIRLDVTREEDDWVRQLVERELGSGVNPAETKPGPTGVKVPGKAQPPAAQPPATTPARPSAPTPTRPSAPAGGGRR
jgi:hypothetical protein